MLIIGESTPVWEMWGGAELEAACYAVTVRCILAAIALVMLCAGTAGADTVDQNVRELAASGSSKVRLAAALALSKSKDARAVIAVADALGKDDDAGIRRVCALALEKMVDARTPSDALALALDALDRAAAHDDSAPVRQTAAKIARSLAALRKSSSASKADKPEVFIKVDPATDPTKKASEEATGRVNGIVRKSVETHGYATSWPGGLPTSAELTSAGSRAFVVASTVSKIEISPVGRQTQIACTVSIRVAPWSGSDGGEKWEANKAASASGSAKAMTGTSARDVQRGVRDCLEAVAEDLTARQILPFLKRLVVASN
jgi:hypothetical protein